MGKSSYILNQLIGNIDRSYMNWLVKREEANKHVKHLTCGRLLTILIWAHLTSRKSLRDIEASLYAHQDKLFRLGIGQSFAKSTIAEALENRPVAVFRDMTERMMEIASKVRPRDEVLTMLRKTYSLGGFYAVDSSIFDLDAGAFPWSEGSGTNKPGIKLHAMFDLLRQVPAVAAITGLDGCDQSFMDLYPYQKGNFYMFDRIYTKTDAWNLIDNAGAYFVLRLKRNVRYVVSENVSIPRGERILADQRIRLSSRWGATGYPKDLRLVSYYLTDKNRVERFVSNNFNVGSFVIPYLYKRRWDIELFFKWIKQHLRIISFFGRSANAVMIQIYSGIITICLLAIVADKYNFHGSLYTLGSILSTALTERRSITEILTRTLPEKKIATEAIQSGSLFSEEEIAKCHLL